MLVVLPENTSNLKTESVLRVSVANLKVEYSTDVMLWLSEKHHGGKYFRGDKLPDVRAEAQKRNVCANTEKTWPSLTNKMSSPLWWQLPYSLD